MAAKLQRKIPWVALIGKLQGIMLGGICELEAGCLQHISEAIWKLQILQVRALDG